MTSEAEIQAHLAEYQALRSEVDHYSQRIDRMSGVYLTALFGIAGYLLRPDSKFDADAYLMSITQSESLTALIIFLTILNSTLMIRIGSFFSGLLAISQYVYYDIRPKITEAVGQSVLEWDGAPSLSAKKIWIPLRSIAQGMFAVIAEVLSFLILLNTFHVFDMSWPTIALYVAGWIFFLASTISLIAVARAGSLFHHP